SSAATPSIRRASKHEPARAEGRRGGRTEGAGWKTVHAMAWPWSPLPGAETQSTSAPPPFRPSAPPGRRPMRREIRHYPGARELSEAAAEAFVQLAQDTVARQGSFSVALSGGSTPRALFELLSGAFRAQVSWERVHL